jgi:hypothetical protein
MLMSRMRMVVVGAVCGMVAIVGAGATRGGAAASPRPLPAHVYAPYFETWTTNRIDAVARRSGARHFTLAFLQAPARGSCTVAWNGDPTQTVAGHRYAADIAALRRMGGDVIPSFGGYSADHDGTEIADSCHSLPKLVSAYESVIRTYGVTRLDMDVEDNSLANAAGIARRNEALAQVERWAARRGRPLQISYTLPVEPPGLESDGLAVLRSAVRQRMRVAVVNIMTFDYYDGTTTHMGAAAIQAARNVHAQLHALYPGRTSRGLWAMEGATILPGIDDYPRKTEVTYGSDAGRLLRFASRVGLNTLSIWAVQRDNGGCPGRIDANNCSGIRQADWAFSHILERFDGL